MLLRKNTIWIDKQHHLTAIYMQHGGRQLWYAYTLYRGKTIREEDREPLVRWDRDGELPRVLVYSDEGVVFIDSENDARLPIVLEMSKTFGEGIRELPPDILRGYPR